MFDLRRRRFITLLGGAAAAWPLAARTQPQRVRRIGILFSGFAADDPEGLARLTAFVQGLQQLGWTDGRNVRIEYRWPLGDAVRVRKYAAELVALAPDAVLAGGNIAVQALQEASQNVPIGFGAGTDPVGAGFVATLAKPGGNITGFTSGEFSFSVKWLELLKQLAPSVTRVAVLRVDTLGSGIGLYTAIQALAPSLGMEVTPISGRDPSETEKAITAFARGQNCGVIVTGGGVQQPQRNAIVAAVAQHRLPAVYPFRRFVTEGGLISYGIDQSEPYRLAASYVDRILKGEKPGDLPVQAATKFEMVINLKTAKAFGIDIPATVLARADEVIE